MTNHPNRNLPIRSKARNAFPGDQVRIMVGEHTDVHNRSYDSGTEYMPSSCGTAGTRPGAVVIQKVMIAGDLVEFAGRKTVHPYD